MINSITLLGNLTKDPETRTTMSGKTVTTFTLAVNSYNNRADFIPCVAWEGIGETIARNVSKGRQLAVSGQIHSRNFEDSAGNKRTALEVNVEDFAFCGKKEKVESADFYEV